jgi:hypothetical protein
MTPKKIIVASALLLSATSATLAMGRHQSDSHRSGSDAFASIPRSVDGPAGRPYPDGPARPYVYVPGEFSNFGH